MSSVFLCHCWGISGSIWSDLSFASQPQCENLTWSLTIISVFRNEFSFYRFIVWRDLALAVISSQMSYLVLFTRWASVCYLWARSEPGLSQVHITSNQYLSSCDQQISKSQLRWRVEREREREREERCGVVWCVVTQLNHLKWLTMLAQSTGEMDASCLWESALSQQYNCLCQNLQYWCSPTWLSPASSPPSLIKLLVIQHWQIIFHWGRAEQSRGDITSCLTSDHWAQAKLGSPIGCWNFSLIPLTFLLARQGREDCWKGCVDLSLPGRLTTSRLTALR